MRRPDMHAVNTAYLLFINGAQIKCFFFFRMKNTFSFSSIFADQRSVIIYVCTKTHNRKNALRKMLYNFTSNFT